MNRRVKGSGRPHWQQIKATKGSKKQEKSKKTIKKENKQLIVKGEKMERNDKHRQKGRRKRGLGKARWQSAETNDGQRLL